MKFKKFLSEVSDNSNVDISDPMSKIKIILSSMSNDELNEFGSWLEDNLSSEDKNTDIDDVDFDDDIDDDIDDIDEFSLNDIIEMIQSLSSDDLNYILYMLQDSADQDDIDDVNNIVPDTTINNESLNKRLYKIITDVLDEDVTARFKASNRNHAKKRFQLTRSQLKAGKAKRKINNIKNRAKRKAYYRKNKVKFKKYAKSYNKAVSTGQHIKKIRR